MDAREISQYLARNAESVASYLLPNGKRVGSEWCAGSINGERGSSLKVHLTGSKAGVWADFAAGEGGDLLDLWRETKRMTAREAIEDVRAHYGFTKPQFQMPGKKAYKRPKKPPCVKPAGKVLDYLLNERRLTQATIDAFEVAADKSDTEIIFPFKRNGELMAVKHVKLQRDDKGKKIIRFSENDCEPCLFGWGTIKESDRTVIITEGEVDCMTMYQYGHAALSIPNGAQSEVWIESEYDNLERFSEILICFDNDDVGQEGAIKVLNRLGRHRCKLVKLWEKDANECLQRGMSKEEIDAMLSTAEYIEPDQLRSPSFYEKKVMELFYPSGGKPEGHPLPWNTEQRAVHFRPHEISIWTGINGHGKTQLLNFLMLDAIRGGQVICIASMELKPERLLYRMYRQICGCGIPDRDDIRKAQEWLEGRLLIYDHVGTADQDMMLDVFAYACKRYGVNQFVIDSLMKMNVKEEDYDAQKDFVNRVFAFAHEYSCHVHLVAHSRKGDDEAGIPGKMDVKGSGTVTNIADNVFAVWRNKQKETAMSDPKGDHAKYAGKPDAILAVHKQRNGDWEGYINLWFDKASYQYLPGEKDRVKPFHREVLMGGLRKA